MSWELVEADLAPIALGAAVLGTGGGGNPYLGMLRARELLRRGLRVRVGDPDELPDGATLVAAGGMGAPVVSWEKYAQGEEEAEAVRALEEHLGRRVDAVAPLEMGGHSGLAMCVMDGAHARATCVPRTLSLAKRIGEAIAAEPITTEVLRYGFRVEVLVLPPSPVLTTPEALRWVGPRAFGYDVDYRPA